MSFSFIVRFITLKCACYLKINKMTHYIQYNADIFNVKAVKIQLRSLVAMFLQLFGEILSRLKFDLIKQGVILFIINLGICLVYKKKEQ